VRKAISIVVAALLAIAVLSTVAVWALGSSKRQPLQTVRGVVESDVRDFFSDPRVEAEFADSGLDVRADTPSDGGVVTMANRHNADFVLGARLPAVGRSYVPFFTPMAVATFADVARALERAGVAHQHGKWWTLDMKAFLDLAARHVRWGELPGSVPYAATQPVLIASPEFSTSNSAAMYASIASYVANGDRVVDSAFGVDNVVNTVSPLFLAQHRTKGAQRTPAMVMTSEAQFVASAGASDHRRRSSRALMYPDPDLLTRFTLVPSGAVGNRVGRLLTDNPNLRRLEIAHGFRTASESKARTATATKNKVAARLDLLNLVGTAPPTVIEALMTRIDAARRVTLGPRPGPAAAE
jgi:hypothetical protein